MVYVVVWENSVGASPLVQNSFLIMWELRILLEPAFLVQNSFLIEWELRILLEPAFWSRIVS
jgi:hypothetical protein